MSESLIKKESVFEKENLPKGWIRTKIGFTIDPSKDRFDPITNKNKTFIGLEHIESNTGKIIRKGESKNLTSTKTIFRSGDILYGRLRPYLNKVCVPNFNGVCSTDILVFKKNSFLSNRFIALFFATNCFVTYANANMTGVQHPRISFKKISIFTIPLPPLNEQHHIVSKIESIFSQIDAGQTKLDAVKILLKQQKQSVLKVAFEGDLVPQDPNDEPAEILLKKIHKNSKEKLVFEKDNLPNGWICVRIKDMAHNPKQDIVDGPFGSNLKSSEYVNDGIPLIRLQNVKRNYFINKNIICVTKEKAQKLKRHNFHQNDIVVTKLGFPVGKACIVPSSLKAGIIVADIIRIRVGDEFVLKKFLTYMINSNIVIKQFNEHTQGTTRPRVNLIKFRNFQIHLPPLNEQKRIVFKIESIFGRIDAIENSVILSVHIILSIKFRILLILFTMISYHEFYNTEKNIHCYHNSR